MRIKEVPTDESVMITVDMVRAGYRMHVKDRGERAACLRALFADGLSSRQAADRLMCTVPAIRETAKVYGVPMPGKPAQPWWDVVSCPSSARNYRKVATAERKARRAVLDNAPAPAL